MPIAPAMTTVASAMPTVRVALPAGRAGGATGCGALVRAGFFSTGAGRTCWGFNAGRGAGSTTARSAGVGGAVCATGGALGTSTGAIGIGTIGIGAIGIAAVATIGGAGGARGSVMTGRASGAVFACSSAASKRSAIGSCESGAGSALFFVSSTD
jgi:hypothetical protein